MIENLSPHNNKNNNICNSCCCGKKSLNTISDIEDLVINKTTTTGIMNSTTSLNNNNSDSRQLVIKQNLDSNKPLSHSLNSLSNTLKTISKSEKSLELIENGTKTLCTCQQSKLYPYCDSTHEIFNSETNSNLSPITIKINNNTQTNTSNSSSSSGSNKKIINKNNIPPTTINKDLNNNNNVKEQQISTEIPKLLYIPPTSFKNPQNQNNHFTIEEVAKHNNVNSCWMIILNKVYDITTYIPRHPGGNKALLRFAGKDGSENVQFHSKKMLELLNNNYFIGHLVKSQQTIEPSMCIIC